MATRTASNPDFKGLARLKEFCMDIARECKVSIVISDGADFVHLHQSMYQPSSKNTGLVASFEMDPQGDYVKDVLMFLRGYRAGLYTLEVRPWAEGVDV